MARKEQAQDQGFKDDGFEKQTPPPFSRRSWFYIAFGEKRRRRDASAAERRYRLFVKTPVWKSLLIMSWPALIQMFAVGFFSFADSLLAVRFASDNYAPFGVEGMPDYVSSEALVRFFVFSAAPLINLLNSVGVLFGVGIATRMSVNLGAGNIERAKNALRVGTMVSTAISILLIPVLWFSARPWIHAQFANFEPERLRVIEENGFQFIWVLIVAYPLQSYYQVNSSIFRVDGRNRELLLISIAPILLNLLFDWLLMGPGKMGVEGASIATVMANFVAAMLCTFFIWKVKSDVFTFKNMYGFKIRWIVIAGVILAGIVPFIRQFAQSITQVVEQSAVQSVSASVYASLGTSASSQMSLIASSALLIFGLFFPVIFGFTQSVRPIASYNYGAKQFKKVKQTYWYASLYATVAGTVLYFIAAFALGRPIIQLLGTAQDIEKTETVLRIIMIGMPLFAFSVAGMTYFGSIDRIFFSVASASLRGFIFLWPVLYIMRDVAIANPQNEYIYWIYYPVLSGLTSVLIFVMATYCLRTMEQPITTWHWWVPRRWVRHPAATAPVRERFGVSWVQKDVYYPWVSWWVERVMPGGKTKRLFLPHFTRRIARFEHITFDERVDRIYAWSEAFKARRRRKLGGESAPDAP